MKSVSTEFGPSNEGVNRYVWDLRYGGIRRLESGISLGPLEPGESERSRYYTRGPLVLPGEYIMAVTVNGQTEKATTTVELDPNLNVSVEDFRVQTEAALAIQKDQRTINEFVERSQEIDRQLNQFETDVLRDATLTARYSSLLAQAKSLDEKIKAFQKTVYNADVQHNVEEDDIHALADLHSKVGGIAAELSYEYGVPPNTELRERIHQLGEEVHDRANAFNALLKNDVGEYNKSAFAAGAPTLFSAPIGTGDSRGVRFLPN